MSTFIAYCIYMFVHAMYMYVHDMYVYVLHFVSILACSATILCLLCCTVIHKFCCVKILPTPTESHSLPLPV